MIGLRITADALAEIEAGAPAIVLGPGMPAPPAPILSLELRDGVLARPGGSTARQLPLPDRARPQALLATPDDAAALLPLLPAGLPVAGDAASLAGILAAALGQVRKAALAAEAERDLLRRALGDAEPCATSVLDRPPDLGNAEPPLAVALGRAAEGLCGIALHVAHPGRGGLLVRLLAGETLLGRWLVPEGATAPGWLALDLPEPAPPGPAEARIDILAEGPDPPRLSLAAEAPALRALTAPAGWSLLPQHFDWASRGARLPALPMPLPAAVLQAAEVQGAVASLVGLGEEAPRLLLDLAPGADATVAFPPVAPGPADLLRARLALRRGEGVEAALAVADRSTLPRALAAEDEVALPLPPAAMVSITLVLRNPCTRPAAVEITALALQAGAAGEPQRLPVAPPAAAAPRPGILPALPPAPPRSAAPMRIAAPAGYTALRVHQHLLGANGAYRHLDIGLVALSAGDALWRRARFKLFDRRGVVGLEFREAAGWPAMFGIWPEGGRDQYGRFWRVETEDISASLRALAPGRDRAFVAAVLEVLPGVALRAAAEAGLGTADAEAWVARARRLAAAVATSEG
ncbi:DUF6212 domain-containing protein [Falsiroseomonas sp. HW251]|uniref:DUF6212 domain-containing protein n=1 Tax=Falsiroseomonas sp. HW251 TaxID=3390998 RepID=UPI003D31A390